MKTPDHNDGLEPVPEELISALGQLTGPMPTVSEEADAVVRERIRTHFDGMRRRRLSWRRLAPIGVAAAAVLALVILEPWKGEDRGTSDATQSRPAVVGDLTGDGRLDMVDAFRLAKRLRDGEATGPELDFNGDGRVDQGDVDALARRAVQMERK